MDIYREEILDHYKNPRNYGVVKKASSKASDRNSSCGDRIEMSWVVEKGRVKAVRFKGEGCAISMAAASMLTEKVKGMKVEEVNKMTEKDLLNILGVKVSSARIKCATLGFIVCKKLIEK